MKIVGVPKMFDDRTAFIDIKDHIGKLPCDFYKMIQVRGGKNIGTEVVYREATDTFHMSAIKEKRVDEYFLEKQKKPIAHQLTEYTYKIQGNAIITSSDDCTIEIAYKAIPVDVYGYPMIPDNPSFTRALKAFITKEFVTNNCYSGDIDPKLLAIAQQDYAWAVGDCETEFNRLSIDEAESFYNMWSQMIVKDNEHARHFEGTGRREKIRLQ